MSWDCPIKNHCHCSSSCALELHYEVVGFPTSPEATPPVVVPDRSVTVTFKAYPIETAPKDREIMLFEDGEWCSGRFDTGLGCWLGSFNDAPTHWAEIEDMRP